VKLFSSGLNVELSVFRQSHVDIYSREFQAVYVSRIRGILHPKGDEIERALQGKLKGSKHRS
jgi:hypothetical protein